jgi:hypothetical protein
MKRSLVVVIAFLTLCAGLKARAPKFEKVFELKPSEGVFAYARISPNGQLLAYASEMPAPSGRGITQTVTVVDLKTKQIVFTEAGIDAYWSNDGKRMIYLGRGARGSSVVIRHHDTGEIIRDVAPVGLGDYFSWSVENGRNLIMTIQSNFYYLDGDMGVMPAGRVTSCPDIGTGQRPLISKDGRRITTFVRGSVVVRSRTDCNDIFDTGLQGAKADFSFDGRYIAFHIPKQGMDAYDIIVIDTTKRTIRNITSSLSGSSLFPSWTQDGRLNFRYDGADYRGFITASDVLSAPEQPLPAPARRSTAPLTWASLFPAAAPPEHATNLVLVWSSWSAHTPDALTELQKARDQFRSAGLDVGIVTTPELSSQRADLDRLRTQNHITLPELIATPAGLASAEALNQSPTTLLFRDGKLVDRKLGAQTAEELRDWVKRETGLTAKGTKGAKLIY